MNYRSIADLAHCVQTNLYKLPDDIDLVVGIPRSGLLAANIIALSLNLKLSDIAGLQADTPLVHGRTRSARHAQVTRPSEAKHILIVDDSIDSGRSLQKIREELARDPLQRQFTYCCVYATPRALGIPDVAFEEVPQPRAFQWNVMHRDLVSESCFDIDGVLCFDPTADDNDDGDKYRRFLLNTRPLMLPTYPIGHLVTSRLEKYRKETEAWLARHHVQYKQLHMLDLPDAETRRRLGCHASFKAGIYARLDDARLFVESEPHQAREIANQSGKPVLSFEEQKMIMPGMSAAKAMQDAKGAVRRAKRRWRRMLDRLRG